MKVNRREYLRGFAAVGAGLLLTSLVGKAPKKIFTTQEIKDTLTSPLYGNSTIKRSICLMCHSACGIQCHISPEGNLVRIRGNPYHANSLEPNLNYEADPKAFDKLGGRICAKGIAGVQHLYDPHRIRHPLKRAGLRGSGKWEVISWQTALNEIVNGGQHYDGENFTGLKDLYNSSDPANPNDPILGPVANQLVYCIGRSEHGRKELTQRLWKDSFGTWNYQNDHTSICELSHHIAYKMVSGKTHLKPDIENVEYLMWFGTRALAANFPFSPNANKIMKSLVDRDPPMKMVVVDPYLSKSASKAYRWIPVIPGTDAALALGMMKVMIDPANNWFDSNYLQNANEAAATADGYPSHTNSAYLVDTDSGDLMTRNDNFVVVNNGSLVEVTGDNAIEGELEPNFSAAQKTGFELLKTEIESKTLDQWADICGITKDIITILAKEFYDHAPRSVADFYRGVVQHSNGYYNAIAIITLNLLVGNFNMAGGLTAGGGHWHEMGGRDIKDSSGNPTGEKTFSLGSFGNGEEAIPQGIGIGRDYGNIKYEDTKEYENNNYPASRPWFPLATNIFQEVFAGIIEKYPYQAKALIMHMANPTYSMPAVSGPEGPLDLALRSTSTLPLFISIDCFMGETTSLADYILPDVTYLERFATPHTSPSINVKQSGFRQPVLGDYDSDIVDNNGFAGGDEYKLFPNTYMAEDIYIKLASMINDGDWLPGFGPNGFGDGVPLENTWDWYKQMILALAKEDTPIIPQSDLSDSDWNKALINYMLDRGGRFSNYKNDLSHYLDASNKDWISSKVSQTLNFYSEKVGTTINVMTGIPFKGVATYEKIKFCDGSEVIDEDYPLFLISYKQAFHTQSRTASIPFLMDLTDNENYIEINSEDANFRGIKTGNKIKITSATNLEGIVGKALVKPGIRPGVIGVSHAFGHFQYGSAKWTENGQSGSSGSLGGDKWIGNGIQSNYVMRLDKIGNTGIQDLIGGSCAFFSTKVQITKV